MINRFKIARKALHLTQEELADKLGTEQVNISNYERGTREPDYQTLVQIADILKVSIDYLLCRDVEILHTIELTKDEQSLLDNYRLLDEQHKEVVRGFTTQQIDNQFLMRGVEKIPSESSVG